MHCGLADGSTDSRCGGLDHADRCWFSLGCLDGFDLGGRSNGGLCWLGLRLDRYSGSGGLLRRRLLDRLGLLRLLRTGQAITSRATFEPIGLCLDQRAGVSLHTNTHRFAERHHFGVGHSELLGELVHSHVFRQNQFSLSLASARRSLFRRPISLSRW
jgi:hypothetical protein